MELKFYGGAQEVGRSSILLKDEKSIMFDFGIKIDHKLEYPTSVPQVDAMVLSHAHLDHSGFTPAIYSDNFVPTFGTMPTMRLSNLLLDDAMEIAKKEHVAPRFSRHQIQELVNRYTAMDYHAQAHFGNYDIKFHDAGHISGSAITLVERLKAEKRSRIVYTGDLKLSEQTLHKGAEVVKSDVLIIESTYATRDHPDREKVLRDFISTVEETLDDGGTALVPAFAVGRSQEILTVLYEAGLASATYIDGMAKEATQIVANFPRFINNHEKLSKAVREVNWVREKGDRREALNGPAVVLTTSGMLNGGPVMDYITKINKKSRILLTGFQQEGTNGKMLLDSGQVMVKGAKRKIGNPVSFYDFSAHSGMTDLYEYVRRSAPEVVVCVHGSEESTKTFADTLKLEGFEAYAPKIGDTIDLGD